MASPWSWPWWTCRPTLWNVAQQPLDDGSLQPVLPSFALQETWFKAYAPKRRQSVARVSALVAWLSLEMASERWQRRMDGELRR